MAPPGAFEFKTRSGDSSMLRRAVTLAFIPGGHRACGHRIALRPFQGVELDTLSPEQREIITQASEDFERVLQGKKPKNAAPDAGPSQPMAAPCSTPERDTA
jgi:hypothetical protein